MRFRDLFRIMENEVPANQAGSGNVDGIGVGDKGEPGYRKKREEPKICTRGMISVSG